MDRDDRVYSKMIEMLLQDHRLQGVQSATAEKAINDPKLSLGGKACVVIGMFLDKDGKGFCDTDVAQMFLEFENMAVSELVLEGAIQ